mmetsp:Transcript_40631/g.121182  ORF Transcript_40631/g.121182 Transcript_40631/m.121182 type:complete len:233 (+) Transcript_40631:1170-1868(+)
MVKHVVHDVMRAMNDIEYTPVQRMAAWNSLHPHNHQHCVQAHGHGLRGPPKHGADVWHQHTATTHLGRPACWARSASIMAAPGSRSLGLRTMVLPLVTAMGIIQSGTMAGKLNGHMPPTTPRGWRTDLQSIPLATFSSTSPMRNGAMPHAASTTSRPRKTSPLASDSVFPCSAVTDSASESMLSRISSWYLSITRVRVGMGVSRHFGNAAFADSTAPLNSDMVVNGRRDKTS